MRNGCNESLESMENNELADFATNNTRIYMQEQNKNYLITFDRSKEG